MCPHAMACYTATPLALWPAFERFDSLLWCPGSVEVVKLLLQHGANLRATCKLGKSALHYAAEVGVSPPLLDCLLRAAEAAGVSEAATEAETVPIAQRRDSRGRTPLHYAASHGDWPICQLLLMVRPRTHLHKLVP